MLTAFLYAIIQFYVCVPIPKCSSVGEGKNIYLWFTSKASEQSFSFMWKELGSPFATHKIPLQAKNPWQFLQRQQIFLKDNKQD